jgi:hypothetical protein
VKGVARCNDLGATGRGSRELNRALDCLRSAIAPKGDLQITRGKLGEPARGAPEHHVEHRLPGERDQLELRAHRFDDPRV